MTSNEMDYDIPLKLKQPDRSIPDSLIDDDDEFKAEYEEEQLYIQSIVNKKSNYNDFVFSEPKKNNIKKNLKENDKKSIKIISIEKNKVEFFETSKNSGPRQFNPRLPIPNKKHLIKQKNNFNILLDDFPAL